jgi:hypothetical protein
MLMSNKSTVIKSALVLFSVFLIHFLFVFAKSTPTGFSVDNPVEAGTDVVPVIDTDVTTTVSDDQPNNKYFLYDVLKLNSLGLSRQAFEFGIKGFEHLLSQGKLHNDQIISIVDFSLASSKKRLFIIDLKNSRVLFHTYVSHGRGSGRKTAREFSNEPESYKSSLGFYVTGGTYQGKHGYSMRLSGEEPGFNNNALSRAIVMHSADYINESIIKTQGFIGRSLGCPALSPSVYKPVIEKIKNGTCLFLYSPNKYYLSHSRIINRA